MLRTENTSKRRMICNSFLYVLISQLNNVIDGTFTRVELIHRCWTCDDVTPAVYDITPLSVTFVDEIAE